MRRPEDCTRPPPADFAELQALDNLRRACAELTDAKAALATALSPVAREMADYRMTSARAKKARAHRELDELFLGAQ